MEKHSWFDTPEPFTRKKFAQERLTGVEAKLSMLVQALESPHLERLVNEGKITVALIKPNANQGRNLPKTDADAAEFLLSQTENKVLAAVTTQLTREEVEEFYAPNKEKFSNRYIEGFEYQTVWDSLIQYSSSGPLTFVLVYEESGNAVNWWRDKMGHTDAERANPDSIRGKYALSRNLPNNLVHGSDSVESVKREVKVFAKNLKRVISN